MLRDNLDLVGNSQQMQGLRKQADKIAASSGPVVIIGPMRSGKTALAHYLRAQSPRRSHPCHRVDCGALSDLNDLFGHRRGAFTGAV